MGRLQLHLRQLIVVLAAVVVGSCSDDVVEVPDHLRGEPTCLWIIGSWGHFADGGMRLIIDEDAQFRTAAACVCMSDADYESGSRADELNDMALEICEDLATQNPFEWDECQQDHDDGEWLKYLFRSVEGGSAEHPSGTALGCIGE